MSSSILRALPLMALVFAGFAGAADDNAADKAFQRQFGDAFFEQYWKLNPDAAISNGYYKFADRLIVPDERARSAELKQVERWSKQLHRIDREKLSPAMRADWTLLDDAFNQNRWQIVDYRSWQWNPAVYNVAEPFALILSLDYAPLEQRLRTFSKRLQNVPAFYAAAKQAIENPTREHTQLAIEQSAGTLGVFGDELKEKIAASKLSAGERTQLEQRTS